MDDFQISKFIRTFFCFSFHSVGVMPSTLLNWCLKLDASLNPTIDPISLTVRSGYSIISFPASRIRSSFLTVRNGLPNLALQKYDSSLLVKPISMRGVSVDSVGSVYRRSRTHCSNAFAALAALLNYKITFGDKFYQITKISNVVLVVIAQIVSIASLATRYYVS